MSDRTTTDSPTAYPDVYEQYPELYHEYPEVASEIYRQIAERGEEWVLENWYQQFLPAGPIVSVPDKEELPFFDPQEHEAWSDEEKRAMAEAYSTYRENLRNAGTGDENTGDADTGDAGTGDGDTGDATSEE